MNQLENEMARPTFDGQDIAEAVMEARNMNQEISQAQSLGGITPLQENDFVRYLLRGSSKIHPVLIFGTTASGKTTMLLSLLNYARANLGVQLGSNVFPSTFPEFKSRYEAAKLFFNKHVGEFSDGKLLKATQRKDPFYIPIDINVKQDDSSLVNIKFAFLEGMGEMYEKDSEAQYNDLKPEITAILTRYTDPISVIFVAPSIDDSGSQKGLDYSHECLTNCMHEYQSKRIDKSRDNILLLASKWDALVPVDDPTGYFASAPSYFLNDQMEKWRFSWPAFKAIPGTAGKALMPYSAGCIKDLIVNPPGGFQPIFDRFNQTLWNWLYGNARQGIGQIGSDREPLYEYATSVKKGPLSQVFLNSLLDVFVTSIIGILLCDQDLHI